jgi:2-polyprenyl-6-methoxyphenol hydroxylase-like FAD-dependent oxidoreductase
MARSASSAEVLVAGGGLAGLAAALGFARRGWRVLLLERDGAFRGGSADLAFDLSERPGARNVADDGTAITRRVPTLVGLCRPFLNRLDCT